MPFEALQTRNVWVFDLDNTLYPAECDLFAEIDQRMTDFVARFLRMDKVEARKVQKQYYAEHGTTLNGLMSLHGMDPADFLAHVHEIDLSPLPQTPDLAAALKALPGQKYIYTNGSRRHAERVTDYMGLSGIFDGQFAIEDSDYTPKPNQSSYDAFLERFGFAPDRAVFFEDLARNLAPAHAMGFSTVLVHSEKDWSHEPENARPAASGDDRPDHIDYVTGNLTQFLQGLTA
ncbi:pyrimidine 5'-nucleotidase [Hyphomonas sp. FCG-A18]|uniref:pyrimidine 5'-nucleotidase n=1 Tax=Hyphomonas sp. FCG-A18 TaxID=3080019 RepID=UPI002B2FDA78|nr:pyrimidine 5'-nucleotidase [Hyphomonas sp. FCG-A18]